MKYALTAEEARRVDDYTIRQMGLPSMVLMERAALCVAEKVAALAALMNRPPRIAAVCGSGNNGADGLAVARILSWQGLTVEVICIGNDAHGTEEYKLQQQILKNSGAIFADVERIEEYDIIIDAIFGIGLNKEISGAYASAIQLINQSDNLVVSVDIPSGIDATTGQVLGVAVEATVTVTFGYHKQGMLLYPGRKYTGEVTVCDIGFSGSALREMNPSMYFTSEDLSLLPAREVDANKGTYGRTLVIAGSEDMSGAAFLSGAAAYRSGCGLVEILTAQENAEVIRKLLPEAIVTGYSKENALELLSKALPKASRIILGPGLSTGTISVELVKQVLLVGEVPLIMDADALNIVAQMPSYEYGAPLIITPHIGEMMRLTGLSKEEILQDSCRIAKGYAKEHHCYVVLKNATTIVAEPEGRERMYLNTSGTPAMAKAGLGDVLTGVIAGMLALRIEPFSAASMGVFIHGICGEMAANLSGEHSLIASDLLEHIGKVMN